MGDTIMKRVVIVLMVGMLILGSLGLSLSFARDNTPSSLDCATENDLVQGNGSTDLPGSTGEGPEDPSGLDGDNGWENPADLEGNGTDLAGGPLIEENSGPLAESGEIEDWELVLLEAVLSLIGP
jgi:hypothetical protein